MVDVKEKRSRERPYMVDEKKGEGKLTKLVDTERVESERKGMNLLCGLFKNAK